MINKDALVSIIIPVYNRANLISETLQSVCNQNYKNWECLVVDDGSTDKTKEVVTIFSKEDNRIRLYERPDTLSKGANSCRNYGYTQSKGNFINWLDSDDLLDNHHIESHLNKHNEDLFQATISVVDTFEKSIQTKMGLWANPFPEKDALTDMCTGYISWQTASVLWSREALPIQPFDEKLHSSQEWMLHISQLIHDISFGILDETTVFVRRHENRIGKDFTAKKYQSMFRSRRKALKMLKTTNKLNKECEMALTKKMLQASKGASRAKYFMASVNHGVHLLLLSFKSNYTKSMLRASLLGIPLYLITGKGEGFFKI